MKKEISSYINGVINSYVSTIGVLETNGAFSTSLNTLKAIKGEFESLLDIVMDIPEENKETAILNFNMVLENRKIKGTNKMLEKTCDLLQQENCNLVKEREALKKDIEVYALSELVWKSICKGHQDEIKTLNNDALDKKRESTMGRV